MTPSVRCRRRLRCRGLPLALAVVAIVVTPESATAAVAPSCRAYLDGLLVGAILGLGLYNLGLYGFVRETSYLFFALYGIGAALYAMSVGERLGPLLWPDFPVWDSLVSWLLIPVSVLCFVRFTQVFLDTATNAPRGNRLLWRMALLLCAGPLIGAPVMGMGWRSAGFAWNTVLALGVFALAFGLGVFCHRRGFAPARVYLAGNTFFMVGVTLYGLGLLGVVPRQGCLRDTALLGVLFQVVFFSLAVADRMARLRRRLAAQQLEQARFERELEVAKSRELEQRVETRTEDLRREKEETERLLYNILPREVARELRRQGAITPRRHDEVSILFTDFEGFTVTVGTIPPQALVAELDAIFGAFDEIVERCGLEKIKTIGDAYLAVSGLPEARPDHAVACVTAALEMAAFVAARNRDSAVKWPIRIGIHSGTVVAGVVGKRKFTYDIWGDAVNIAARMESAADPGRVNVSAYTYHLVRDHFRCDYRGKIAVKGKGPIDMYHVAAPRRRSDGAAGPGRVDMPRGRS